MRNSHDNRRLSLWVSIPIVMVVTMVWTNTDYPVDYWLHINNGKWMIDTGQLVTTDTFSHTIDSQPVRNQPWLAQLMMYQLHHLGGYRLNQFVAGLAYAFAVATMMWLVKSRCGNWTISAVGGVLALAVMSTNMGVRPQYFSAVLFVVQIALVLRVRSIWLLSMGTGTVTALWTNLHGAYPLGVVVPAIFLGAALVDSYLSPTQSDRQRVIRFLAAAATSAIGCFARPAPGDAISYVTNCSKRSVERELVEWLPTSLTSEAGGMFFVSLSIVIAVIALSRRRLLWWELMMVGAFFFLASSSQRMVLWWAFVFPIVLSRPADQLWRSVSRWNAERDSLKSKSGAVMPSLLDRAMGCLVGTGVVVFLIFSTPWSRSANACLPSQKRVVIPNGEPRALVEQVLRSCDHNLDAPIRSFSPLAWASYLTWRSDGKLKSFVDTRVDFFPDDVWDAYMQIAHGEALALELLDRYRVDLVICDLRQEKLIGKLIEHESWQESCRDHTGITFERGS